jgi:hypothetical protein
MFIAYVVVIVKTVSANYFKSIRGEISRHRWRNRDGGDSWLGEFHRRRGV